MASVTTTAMTNDDDGRVTVTVTAGPSRGTKRRRDSMSSGGGGGGAGSGAGAGSAESATVGVVDEDLPPVMTNGIAANIAVGHPQAHRMVAKVDPDVLLGASVQKVCVGGGGGVLWWWWWWCAHDVCVCCMMTHLCLVCDAVAVIAGDAVAHA